MNRRDLETLTPLAWIGLVPLRSHTTALWSNGRTSDRGWRGSHDGPRTTVQGRQAQNQSGESPMRALHHRFIAWGVYDVLQILLLTVIVYWLVTHG
jgi:hypothetical protein